MESSSRDSSVTARVQPRENAVRALLSQGTVIPAHPLALTPDRKLDERRQRALTRYYLHAGAGGIAVGVHTTDFGIRAPQTRMLESVLSLAAEEVIRHESRTGAPVVRVAGICGATAQAVSEAELARDLGYDFGLLNLSALRNASAHDVVMHCRTVADTIGLFGFYLQTAVGGTELPYSFWRSFCEIDNVCAIKIAAFDRYRTIDVVRAVAETGRGDIALYTGNDDNIVADLITPYTFSHNGRQVTRRFVGGLLGHWAVWTRRAVELQQTCRRLADDPRADLSPMLEFGIQVTDANAAVFDAAHRFRGCLPGILEVLRRQGLVAGTRCLDPDEQLSPGQAEELDRIQSAYPHLTDDDFVSQHLDDWLSG